MDRGDLIARYGNYVFAVLRFGEWNPGGWFDSWESLLAEFRPEGNGRAGVKPRRRPREILQASDSEYKLPDPS